MKTSRSPLGSRRSRESTVQPGAKGVKAGIKILAAIEQATEALRSEGLDSNQMTVRTYARAPARRTYRPADVKRVRQLLGTSQAVLARFLGVNINTVRSWEQGKRPPQPIACRFLAEIESDPVYWRRRIKQENGLIEDDILNGP
jgi:putative transcriptional regulator